MLKRLSLVLAPLSLLLSHAPSAEAGAWVRSEGSSLLRLSVGSSSADSEWDRKRRRVNTACDSRRHSVGVHGEYGYSYYHTVFAAAELSSKDCRGGSNVQGLSDLTVGVRGRLDPFRNGRAWEVALKLPISGTSADRDRPGNGEFGIDAGIHIRMVPDAYDHAAQRDHKGVWSWGSGVRLWTGGLAHQAWAYGGWSRDLNDVWGLSTRLAGTLSFGGSKRDSDGRIRNDYDKLTASIGLNRSLSQTTSLSVSLSRDLLGRNTDQATGIRLSISRSWR